MYNYNWKMKEFNDKDLGFIQTADENFLDLLSKYWKVILLVVSTLSIIFTYVFVKMYMNKQKQIHITSKIIALHKTRQQYTKQQKNIIIDDILKATNNESQIALLLIMKEVDHVKEFVKYIDDHISYKSQYMNNTDYIDNMNYITEVLFLKVIFLLAEKQEITMMKMFYMERKLQSSPFSLLIYFLMTLAEKNLKMLNVLYKNFAHYPGIFDKKYLSGINFTSSINTNISHKKLRKK